MVLFGRLEKVDARETWATEASHFTPWLAKPENLSLLGDTIGVDLELEAQEKSVGPFRADLLCKDTVTGNWVLIENQLERTDHIHLGQLLTYAAGLKAVTIVWIAKLFTEEHRAALDWLNEITDSRFNFFGLEIELWKIGDSQVAPKFNIVCKPNDWSKTVAEGASRVESEALTEVKQIQLEFWTAFREYVLRQNSRIKPTKPLPQHWMNIAIGRSGFGLSAIASFWDSQAENYGSNELRAELVIRSEHSKEFFEELALRQDQITNELGYSLTWYNPQNARKCKVYVRRSANLRDRNAWPEQQQWLWEKLEEFHRVFGPIIRNLNFPVGSADGTTDLN